MVMRSFIAICLMGVPWSLLGQTPGLPEAAVAPWQILGVDPALTASQKTWLTQQRNALVAQSLTNPQTFNLYAKPASANAALMAGKIHVGFANAASLKGSLIQPILCGLNERIDVFMIGSRLATDQLLGIVSVNVDQDLWQNGTPAPLSLG